MIKIFFFDRDGVLIKNYGYLCDVKKIKWLNGAISAINFLNKKKNQGYCHNKSIWSGKRVFH